MAKERKPRRGRKPGANYRKAAEVKAQREAEHAAAFDERERNLVRLIEKGYQESHAHRLAGVPKSTYFKWLDQGRRDEEAGIESRLATFYARIEAAKAQKIATAVDALQGFIHGKVERTFTCEAVHERAVTCDACHAPVKVQLVCNAPNVVTLEVPHSVKATAFFLERQDPEHWGRRDKLDIAHHIGAPELRSLLEELALTTQAAVHAALGATPAAEALLEQIGKNWHGLVTARAPHLLGAGDQAA